MSRLNHASAVRDTPSHEARAVETASPTGDRDRLRALDACLHTLENAHEHNLLTVSPGLAETLRTRVAGIEAGMTITDAIEVVLREQEPCLRSRRLQQRPVLSGGTGPRGQNPGSEHQRPSLWGCEDDPVPAAAHGLAVTARCGPAPDTSCGGADGPGIHEQRSVVRRIAERAATGHGFAPRLLRGGDGSPAPLDEPAARSLTERIKRAVGNTCVLLLEAHSRRAWCALGYATWEQYVRAEFGLSRSRSYELLDHARIVRTIEVAAGVSGIADISTFAARQLKPRLQELAAEVRIRTANAPQSQLAGIVARVIGEQRAKLTRSAGAHVGETRRHCHHAELDSLCHAIDTLAHMPSVEAVVARIPLDQRRRLEPVGAAAEWLTRLAGALDSSQP